MGGMVVAFTIGWYLALIISINMFVYFITWYQVMRVPKLYWRQNYADESANGSQTEETLGAIQLVISFANEESHIEAYK